MALDGMHGQMEIAGQLAVGEAACQHFGNPTLLAAEPSERDVGVGPRAIQRLIELQQTAVVRPHLPQIAIQLGQPLLESGQTSLHRIESLHAATVFGPGRERLPPNGRSFGFQPGESRYRSFRREAAATASARLRAFRCMRRLST